MPSDRIHVIYRGPHGCLIADGCELPAHREVMADRDQAMRLISLGHLLDIREPEPEEEPIKAPRGKPVKPEEIIPAADDAAAAEAPDPED